tara:strand:- start:6403 stop:7020 length:618 start_codon:yes stop_codon:yes gene_type:complete
MSIPTNAVSTELDAVNQILSSVGQAPVTTLDMKNPEVYITLETLREVNRQVQSEGWTFNTENHVELTRNSVTNKITYPTNALAVDANEDKYQGKYDIVKRDGFLYDKKEHSYTFTEDLVVDMVWLFSFDDVPKIAQTYIINRAARLASVKLVGDSELYQLLQEQEAQSRVALLEYETNQGDYNMFGCKEGEYYGASYQPFNVLTR